MNKVLKYMTISIGINFVAGVILVAPLFMTDSIGWGIILLFLTPLSLFVQMVVGIVYAVGDKNPELGKGMLLSVGFFFLLGLSICGGARFL